VLRKQSKKETAGASTAQAMAASGRRISVSDMLRKYGLVFAILIMVVVLSSISGTFFTSTNIINVLRQISINGILALGMTFVILTSGIDLSVGSLVAVSGVVCGSIVFNNPDAIWLGFLGGVLVCGLFGAITGFMIMKFRIPGFIATLAMMTIARGFALVYSDGRPYVLTSEKFKLFGQGYVGIIPVPVVILIIVVLLTLSLLYYTKFGRYVYAIGGNPNAARASGINVGLTTMIVYTLNGLLAGLAGVILASRINSGQPAIGVSYEMDAIAAVVIGGTSLSGGIGKISGTILGFLIIGIINNGLNLLNVSSYYQQIVKGLIIAGAVILDTTSKRRA
jgi:ribose/xylose/arabinose/galactoside ABC-type transport system permease subunit